MFIILLVLWYFLKGRHQVFGEFFGNQLSKVFNQSLKMGFRTVMALELEGFIVLEDQRESFQNRVISHFVFTLAIMGSWLMHLGFQNLFFLGFISCFCLALPYLRLIETEKKNQQMIQSSLPGMITHLALLINTGIVSKNALEKIVANPQNSFELAFLHRIEMMSKGMSMEHALMPIAQSCYNDFITRLIRILLSEKRNGSEDTYMALLELISDIKKYKKTMILKKGEEVSTKLLLPMAISLIGIIVAMVYPAIIELFTFS